MMEFCAAFDQNIVQISVGHEFYFTVGRATGTIQISHHNFTLYRELVLVIRSIRFDF